MKTFSVVVLALVPALLLSGCGGSDPAGTARAFMEASKRGDDQAMKSLLTKKAQENLNKKDNNISLKKNGADNKGDYTVGQATVTGDTAQVPITVKENGKDSTGQ